MHRSPLSEVNFQSKSQPSLADRADSEPNQDHSEAKAKAAGPVLQGPAPPLNAVNVGYGNEGCGVSGTTPTTPKTPLKPSLKSATPPLTPLANLKVLIAAASTALESEQQQEMTTVTTEVRTEEESKIITKETEDAGGRKMKSLAILCKRFLSIAESEIGVGTDFSLDSMSTKLGTNRRRIYDIINVLEALEMIVKQSKNWYTWLGQNNLLVTLAKMRAMAEDDVDFRSLLHKENGLDASCKENHPSVVQVGVPGVGVECKPGEPAAFSAGPVPGMEDGCSVGGGGGASGGGRWDKSLGVLCQKFIMLFLVTPDNEVTLDFAGNILMPDDGSFALQPTNPKTKVRRLYDIANVLTTLGLIRKKTFLAPNHRKMPGYSWAGPSLDQILTISVFRKSELNLYPFYSKKKGGGGGVALSRRPSFGGSMRPFLHQYEVKGQPPRAVSCGPNSVPSSPVKSKDSGFKRSLSFGAGISKMTGKIPCAPVTTPSQRHMPTREQPVDALCATPTTSQGAPFRNRHMMATQMNPGQMDYLQEVREFEAELQKHSHKYPHVAPVFREFVSKFQSTLEQVAVNPDAPKIQGTLEQVAVNPGAPKILNTLGQVAVNAGAPKTHTLGQFAVNTGAQEQVAVNAKTQNTLEQVAVNAGTPKVKATPTPLSSPPFNVTASDLTNSFFLSPQPSPTPMGQHSPTPIGVTALAPVPLGKCLPGNSSAGTPAGVLGNAGSLPPSRPTTSAEPVTSHNLSPRSRYNKQFACAENVGVNHILSRTLPVCATIQVHTRPTSSVVGEGSGFNPNSLLVSTANGGYAFPPRVLTPSSSNFLPLYPISIPGPSAVGSKVTCAANPVRSLAPKPNPLVSAEQLNAVATAHEEEDATSPPKRARLDYVDN